MLSYILIALCVLLVLLLGWVMHRAGIFYRIKIRTSTPKFIPSRIAYKVYRGPYRNAGAAYNDIEQFAPQTTTFGIYYDDPHKVRILQICKLFRVISVHSCSLQRAILVW